MRKILKRCLIGAIILIAVLFIGFNLYTLDYYRAFDGVEELYMNDSDIVFDDDYSFIYPQNDNGVAIVFYPGGKVEHFAYYPMLRSLADLGYTIVMIDMPYNLAVFGQNKADYAIEQLSRYESVYIMGHSLGGAMASVYAEKNPEKVSGLIVLGAYVYGDYPIDQSLTIYGTFNSNLEESFDYTNNVVKIEGGNHAQFGNYGPQKGDPDATITAMEQQSIAIMAIVDFIGKSEE